MIRFKNTILEQQHTAKKGFQAKPRPALQNARPEIILIWWLFTVLWLIAVVGAAALTSPIVIALFSVIPFMVFAVSPLAGFIVFLTSVIWQNTIISMWSPLLTRAQMNTLQGINFVIITCFGVYSIFVLLRSNANMMNDFSRRALKLNISLLFVGVIYTVYGMAANSFFGSIIYFRNFSGGLFCLAMGIYFGQRLGALAIIRVWCVLGIIVIIQAFVELAFTEYYYEIINLNVYYGLKKGLEGIDVNDTIEKLTKTLFNTPYFKSFGLDSFRMLGPNLHNISFGYLLSYLVFAFSIKRKFFLSTIAFILIVLIGAKGPTILVVLSLGLDWLFRRGYPRSLYKSTIIAVCITLIVVFIIYGIKVADYHVLGLIGGIKSFLSNPLGHGFGYGGNYGASKTIDWQETQRAGAAPFGLESSVGVLLSQWGICGVLYILYLIWIWRHMLNHYIKTSFIVNNHYFSLVVISFGFVITNLVFQEEALSPYAIGFGLLWVGLLSNSIGKSKETQEI